MKKYENMEKLLEDLKSGVVRSIDLDEETELRFIIFMKEHIRNNMEEIENMNKQIQKTEKETAQILEETSKMNFQNKELNLENARLDKELIKLALATEDYQDKINQIKGNLNN